MRTVSIPLTDDHADQIAAHVSAGDYPSEADVIRAALDAFLRPAHMPSPMPSPMPSQEQIDRDIAEYDAERARGEPLIPAETAFKQILDDLGS